MSRARFTASLVAMSLALAACSVSSDPDFEPGCRAVSASGEGLTEGAYGTPERGILILAAQAVPSATLLPCVDALPTGWTFSGWRATNGAFRFWLDSDRAGLRAVEVVLTAECDPGSAVEVVPSDDEAGTRRFEQPLSLPPNFAADRFYEFEGGCVQYRYRFQGTSDPALALEADQALGFRDRQNLVSELEGIGLILCGAGARPCAGEER